MKWNISEPKRTVLSNIREEVRSSVVHHINSTITEMVDIPSMEGIMGSNITTVDMPGPDTLIILTAIMVGMVTTDSHTGKLVTCPRLRRTNIFIILRLVPKCELAPPLLAREPKC